MSNLSQIRRALVEAAQAEMSSTVRTQAAVSLELFARYYLKHHFPLAPSAMHKELFASLTAMTKSRGVRLAVAAPRGHAKSTIVSLAYPLWCICFRHEPSIIMIANTGEQSQEYLANIKRELETNALLARDFPDAAGPAASPPWRKAHIVTRNQVSLLALGAGSQIRGRKFGCERPGLIILDDVESAEGVRTAEQRAKLDEWFRSAVSQSGTSATNIVAVGTTLHPESLLSNLTNPAKGPGWTGRRYRAVISFAEHGDLWERWQRVFNGQEEFEGRTGPEAARSYYEANQTALLEGAEVLWPLRESYYDLMVIRVREGVRAFSTEKQNDPMSPDDALFKESQLHFWDERFPTEAALMEQLSDCSIAYGACDPSLGKAGRGRDYTAIVTVLREQKTGAIYVVHTDIAKRTPDQIIETIIRLHQRFHYCAFGFESNQFQEVLGDRLRTASRARGAEIPVVPIRNQIDKMSRLQRLQPVMAAGGVLLSRRHPMLMDQLLAYPHGAHDDGPDALEMAWAVAQHRPVRLRVCDMNTGKIYYARRRGE
jgi:predicted phage terminase large subunit-like protein